MSIFSKGNFGLSDSLVNSVKGVLSKNERVKDVHDATDRKDLDYLYQIENKDLQESKIPDDKALKAVIDTFESLNKTSGVSATDLKLEKKGANKWVLTSTKGGDMTIDNKRASNLNVSADTKGPWRLEMNKWKAKDLANFLKKQGVEEQ